MEVAHDIRRERLSGREDNPLAVRLRICYTRDLAAPLLAHRTHLLCVDPARRDVQRAGGARLALARGPGSEGRPGYSDGGGAASSARRPLLSGDATASRAETAERLAPAAVLALAVQALARALVKRGVEEATRQVSEAAAAGAGGRSQPRRRNKASRGGATALRALTPAHVLAGVARAAPASAVDSAVWVCLARLGERRGAVGGASGPARDLTGDSGAQGA